MSRYSKRKARQKEFVNFVENFDHSELVKELQNALYKSWRDAADRGYSIGGRGALVRTVSSGFGKTYYFPLEKLISLEHIQDSNVIKMIELYNPETEFVVGEPNEETGGTRWKLFNK